MVDLGCDERSRINPEMLGERRKAFGNDFDKFRIHVGSISMIAEFCHLVMCSCPRGLVRDYSVVMFPENVHVGFPLVSLRIPTCGLLVFSDGDERDDRASHNFRTLQKL